jgi:hypothetical protein
MMWLTLTLNRIGHAGKLLRIGLMVIETALVFGGSTRAAGLTELYGTPEVAGRHRGSG